ncbi:MAG: rhodanese-like domain-containing protein [Dehalococcoidia bacterium]
MDSGTKLRALEPGDIQAMVSEGAYVVDLRDPARFGKGYIRGSINIQSPHKKFEERVAMIIPPERDLILVADSDAQVEEAVIALWKARGEHLSGYAHGGIDAWVNVGLPVATLRQLSLHELKRWLTEAGDDIAVLDVREPFEWVLSGCIEGAILIPLGQVERRRSEIPREREVAVICEHGIRSSTAASLLERHGFDRCLNVKEGMNGWRKAGYPRAKYRE